MQTLSLATEASFAQLQQENKYLVNENESLFAQVLQLKEERRRLMDHCLSLKGQLECVTTSYLSTQDSFEFSLDHWITMLSKDDNSLEITNCSVFMNK